MSRAVLALAALASAAPAWAFDVYGSLSSGYYRTDTASGGVSASAPTWDYGGSLGVMGSPLRPGLLHLDANADYRQQRNLYDTPIRDTDNLTYSGSALLFSQSPLSFSLNASRQRSEFASDLSASTGVTTSSTNGVTAVYVAPNLPRLFGSFTDTESENEAFGSTSSFGSRAIAAGAAQTIGPHSYNLQYSTNEGTGSFADSNFRSHYLTFHNRSQLTDKLHVAFTDNYFLREPKVQDATSPRVDNNALTASVGYTPVPRETYNADYFYSRLVSDQAPDLDREVLTHAAGGNGSWGYTPELTLLANARVTYTDQRLAATRAEGVSEQVGAGARWQRVRGERSHSLESVLSVGLLHLSGQGTDLGYGVSGSAQTLGKLGAWGYGLGYSLGFNQNLGGVSGYGLTHGVNASADRALRRARVNATASFYASRQDSDLLGASLSRTTNLGAGVTWRRLNLQLNAGITDGLANSQSGFASGILLPAGYNTHSRFANLTAGTSWGALALTGIARYVEVETPSRPLQTETGGSAILSYAIGAFVLSAEDRYSVGHSQGVSQSNNIFLVRATRHFSRSF